MYLVELCSFYIHCICIYLRNIYKIFFSLSQKTETYNITNAFIFTPQIYLFYFNVFFFFIVFLCFNCFRNDNLEMSLYNLFI